MEEIKWPKITKDTPLPELKRIHQMIWDYAIERGEKPKTLYESNCVACEYNRGKQEECRKCPIRWPKNAYGVRMCTSAGLYDRWDDAKGERKIALARQIRDLPWKYELEENTPP